LGKFIITPYNNPFFIVQLKGMPTWERAAALISIAHPMFRDELTAQSREMKIWLDRKQ
jgi:acyl-CoA hydrolase